MSSKLSKIANRLGMTLEELVLSIRSRIEAGESREVMCREFGLSLNSIRNIGLGLSYQNVHMPEGEVLSRETLEAQEKLLKQLSEIPPEAQPPVEDPISRMLRERGGDNPLGVLSTAPRPSQEAEPPTKTENQDGN